MTISVRSRISVTTPDGRSHTGVVTGLRGQGMADLLLDDGRAIRQPVSALRPVLARTNGRHARLNPRARRNTGDNYARLAQLLLNGGDRVQLTGANRVRLTVADRTQLTGRDTPTPAIIAGILARLQDSGLLTKVQPSQKLLLARDQAQEALFAAEMRVQTAKTEARDEYKQKYAEELTPAVLRRRQAEVVSKREALERIEEQIAEVTKGIALREGQTTRPLYANNDNSNASLAAALRTRFEESASADESLSARLDRASAGIAQYVGTKQEALAKDHVLLSSFLSLLQDEQPEGLSEAQERVKDERSQREEEEVKRLRAQAERVRTGRQEQRTTEERLRRERTQRLGGIGLPEFIEREKVAVKIIPDPLRETRDKSYLCGNALDGYAYTLASTAERRVVRHWLTWGDLGLTDRGTTAPSYTVMVAEKRGGPQEARVLDFEELLRLIGARDESLPLGRAYSELVVRRAGEGKKGAGETKAQLKRTPISRQDTDGRPYNEFEINFVDELPESYERLPDSVKDTFQTNYDLVDVKPALQRVRAGSQSGSLYPRRPMPPESPSPGALHPDAPVLLALRMGSGSPPDVFGFTVDREIETAAALLDKYKPYPGYSYKDRNPYFSWQPEAAGQFSAMQGKKGERPCNNPEVIAQLNALRKATYTMQALVKAARRLNEVLSAHDGIDTLADANVEKRLIPSFERVISACVRVVRLRDAIKDQKYIAGSRLDSTSDFSVFADPAVLVTAVMSSALGADVAPKVQVLRASIDNTKNLVGQLGDRMTNLQFVKRIAEKQKESDVEKVRVEASDARTELSRIVDILKGAVTPKAVDQGQEPGPGIKVYAVTSKFADSRDAPFVLVAGALCNGARLVDILASLFPLAQLAPPSGEDTAMAAAMPPEEAARYILHLARIPAAGARQPSDRLRVKQWLEHVRRDLLPLLATAWFRQDRAGKVQAEKFRYLIDLLVARQQEALRGDGEWRYREWQGETDPEAAALLFLQSSLFLGDARVGGLLGKVQARTNAGGGSTESDRMVKRTRERGYEHAEALTPAQAANVAAARAAQRLMPRSETRALSAELMRKSQEKVAQVAEQKAKVAATESPDVVSFADDLKTSLEFAQNALVGGGTVREVSGNVKMHYTYNPLLFQLVRLYYKGDTARLAQGNPREKPEADAYVDVVSALAASPRLPRMSAFAQAIPMRSGPVLSTSQMVAQIRTRLQQHPKSYQKTLSWLDGKKISETQVSNELRATLPRLLDHLRFYRSRIESAFLEGQVTEAADTDRQLLLLSALDQALSEPPGTAARSSDDTVSFSVEVIAPRRRATQVSFAPEYVAPARPSAPLPDVRLGQTEKDTGLPPNVFEGFSREKPGGGKGEYEIINKPLLYMIDWIGVYGSLLDLVRRALLKYEVQNGAAAANWDEAHEGWVALFQGMTLNAKLPNTPQLWLDLCPAAEDRKDWADRYDRIVSDDSGEQIKETVLWVKARAARGLAYAGELARRGFGAAEYTHKSTPVDTTTTDDVFLRVDRKDVSNARTEALKKLLVSNSPAMATTLHIMGEDDRAAKWAAIAKSGPDAVLPAGLVIPSLVSLSIRPLLHLQLLSAEESARLTNAIVAPKSTSGKPQARETIVLTHDLFTAYVRAMMTFYFRTEENIPAPKYPTAPQARMVQSIQATAGDAPIEQEPPDSFLGISLDREDMRRTLLQHIEAEQKRLKAIAMSAYGERSRTARRTSQTQAPSES